MRLHSNTLKCKLHLLTIEEKNKITIDDAIATANSKLFNVLIFSNAPIKMVKAIIGCKFCICHPLW